MRRIPHDDLKPGMIIARTVIDLNGNALLTKNTQLTEKYIIRLKDLGIGSIYVKDGLGDVEVPEIISEQVRSTVTGNLNNSMKNLSSGKSINMNSLRKSVNLLLDNIISSRNLLIQLEEIRTYNDYLFLHSINVAIFALMTGRSLGYSESNLVELGMGALLHDIGMIAIDSSILHKSQVLSQEESNTVKMHTQIGFNILRTYREVSTQAAHVAYQHHERMDGQGYPRRLCNNEILEYAKIVAVVDTFDAIISDRPFRYGYTITDALLVIKKLGGNYFDPEIVEAFASNVAMYPMGSIVKLNNGELAVVVAVNKYQSQQPVVRLLDKDIELDLGKTTGVSIYKRLSYQEVDTVRKQHNLPGRIVHQISKEGMENQYTHQSH